MRQSRTKPDRPGPKTEIKGRGGPRTGPDRIGQCPDRIGPDRSRPALSWKIGTVWPCQKARPCPLKFQGTVRPCQHARPCRLPFGQKKRKILLKFGPSVRSTCPTGSTQDRTEDRIQQKLGPKRTSLRRSSVWSDLGPKTAHP